MTKFSENFWESTLDAFMCIYALGFEWSPPSVVSPLCKYITFLMKRTSPRTTANHRWQSRLTEITIQIFLFARAQPELRLSLFSFVIFARVNLPAKVWCLLYIPCWRQQVTRWKRDQRIEISLKIERRRAKKRSFDDILAWLCLRFKKKAEKMFRY